MANFCRYCGKSLPEGAYFCPYCGKYLKKTASQAQAAPAAPQCAQPQQ